jgi:CheY-like chemotaxis protein
VQRVVVVNGAPDVLELLESVLEGGRYDLLFADSSSHAYSLIAREQPHLVVLCTTIDRADGFQLLSMLKLDRRTRDIPVVTYTMESADQEDDQFRVPEADDEMVPAAPPLTRH